VNLGTPPRPDLPGEPAGPARPGSPGPSPPAAAGPAIGPSSASGDLLPAATWSWWEAIPVYLVAQLVAVIPLVIADALGAIDLGSNRGPTFVLELFVGEAGFALAVVFWVRVVHSTPLAALGLPRQPLRDLATGILAGMGLYVAGFVVGLVVDSVAQAILGHQPILPDQVPGSVTGIWLALTGPAVILAAPFGEELLFRGFLYRGLRRRLGVWPAVAASAGLFAMGHVQGWSFFYLVPPLFAVGAGLALVYERRQSLLASMAAHGTFNLIGFIFIASRHT
jgi:membrane protease YdiL (CAAX protease family)